MKKLMKQMVVALLTVFIIATMMLGVTGCSKTTEGEKGQNDTTLEATDDGEKSDEAVAETKKKYKIIVFTLQASGQLNDAFAGFLAGVADELNFEYDVRYKGETASEYLGKVQTAISEGYNGVIAMKDEGNTNELVALCEENGVYFGNIWNNQGASLNASSGGYAFLNSPYFVGGLADCEDSMAPEAAAYTVALAEAYYDLPEEEKVGVIGFTTMPPMWQPNQVSAVENMYQLLKASTDEGGYGVPESAFAVEGLETREEQAFIGGKPVAAGTYIWPSLDVTSMKLASRYFDQNPNMQLLISTLAYTFINPALDSSNKLTGMKVWVTGFDNEPALVDNFGTLGNQTYQGCRTAPIESLAMPLVQILDKLEGNAYPDKEEAMKAYAEITDENKFALKDYQINPSPTIIIINDEALDAYLNHNVYGTTQGEDSLLDAEMMKQMMVTYNSQASYRELVEIFSGRSTVINMESILKRAN